MRENQAILIAGMISPLTAGVGYGLAFYLRHPDLFYELLESQGLYHLTGPDVFVTGFAYGLTLALGLPGYLVLRKWNLNKSYLVVGWAVVIGGLFSLVIRNSTDERAWEYGVLPAIAVSLTSMVILSMLTMWPKKIISVYNRTRRRAADARRLVFEKVDT